MNNKEIFYELSNSKKQLEDKLGIPVNAFSIPYGFGNKNIIQIAFDLGYKSVCTSKTTLASASGELNVYGRFGVRRSDDMSRFKGIVDKSTSTLMRVSLEESGKTALKKILGRYLWLTFRNKVLKLKSCRS